MAKYRSPPAQKKASRAVQNQNKWERKLPPVYATLLAGFHAKNHVKTFVGRLGMDKDVDVPKQLANICIGSFTPDMFEHDRDFWSTPVPKKVLEEKPSMYQALMDPDIAELQNEASKHIIDTDNPTLEDLARVMQTQYLAYHARMSQLTNNDLLSRLEKLKDPKFYNELKDSAVVRSHKLQAELPKKMPDFKVDKKKLEFSTKNVKTALQKAYGRSGKPESYDEFIRIESQPKPKQRHGVFAVSDVQRMSLSTHSKDKNSHQIYQDYMGLRNILLVALYEGELGVHIAPDDITDRVNYPSAKRPSRQYPSLVAKGKIYHAGPKGYYLECPMELQVTVLSPDIVDQTHRLYEISRGPGMGPLEKASIDKVRLDMQSSSLSPYAQVVRTRFMQEGVVPDEDRFARQLLFQGDKVRMTQHAQRHAVAVAMNEFPEALSKKSKHNSAAKGAAEAGLSVTKLKPFTHRLDVDVSTTLGMMINQKGRMVGRDQTEFVDPIIPGVPLDRPTNAVATLIQG